MYIGSHFDADISVTLKESREEKIQLCSIPCTHERRFFNRKSEKNVGKISNFAIEGDVIY